MSRPTPGPSRPLGTTAKPNSAPQPGGAPSAAVPRRSAGTLPGLARTASSLRQGQANPSSSPSLASLPAHLRNLSTPRIPSPLGKGTPHRQLKQSLPVRTSKTTERHVFLPEDPQLAPIPKSPMGSQVNLTAPPRAMPGPSRERHHGPYSYDERSDAEKMTKREREENKLPRFTAYATAEGYRLKLLQAFLKREHGVPVVRVFDDCIYAVYNLPLLPGYGASTQIRSSPHVKSPGGVSLLERMTIAEDMGYNDSYFPDDPNRTDQGDNYHNNQGEYILAHSPPTSPRDLLTELDGSPGRDNEGEGETSRQVEADAEVEAEQERDREQESERQQANERQQDGQEELDSPTNSDNTLAPSGALGLLPGEEDEPFLAEADRDAKLIEVGTHMSPTHPGYLEHIPSQALSPSELHPDPRDVPHILIHSDDRDDQSGSTVPEPQQTAPSRRYSNPHGQQTQLTRRHTRASSHVNNVAEAVFFSYGVSVFFGFQEREEKEIMEDCEKAGTWIRPQKEDDWEVEECHYMYDADTEYPRIYNDMFTFKSHSHLFKLSLAHAVAQSTKLSIYEAIMQESLSLTSEFPKELSITGHLQLSRRDALKMTGRLFKLRMDVNLIGGILDTPELFWSEASLFPLYEAIREYLEIGPRVQVLNDRLSVAGDLLEIIHEYIEERATHRITWIIIWLIVAACLVEMGEVVARMIFHTLPRETGDLMLLKAGRMVVEGVTGRQVR